MVVATQEQTHDIYRAREMGRPAPGGGGGGGGGKRHCTFVHIPVYLYMNRVLPKWNKNKEVSSYLSLVCNFRKGLLHGMSYTKEKKSCMN